MPSNPGSGEQVARADDLTRITGIGTKIARRLTEAGIATYAELASHSADDIMALLPDVSGLPLTRIEGWRDEAGKLAAEQAQGPAGTRNNDQHYESFLVRVLLNEDGSFRRTSVRHIGSGAERQWPGLGRDALPDFIEARAGSAAPSTGEPVEKPAAGLAPEPGAVPAPRAAPGPGAAPEPETATASHGETARGPRFASPAVLSVERTTLHASEPFTMTMAIDLTGSPASAGRLGYKAVIVAKPLGGGPKRTVAQSDGLIPVTAPTISIDAAGLPPGAYRLDGAVSLFEPGSGRALGLAAIAEGLLVHVPSA